jgi:hypothetical protein
MASESGDVSGENIKEVLAETENKVEEGFQQAVPHAEEYIDANGNSVKIVVNHPELFLEKEWPHVLRLIREAIRGVTVDGVEERLEHPDKKATIDRVQIMYDFLLSFLPKKRLMYSLVEMYTAKLYQRVHRSQINHT